MTTDLRRWAAVGTGVGVEVCANDLRVTIARVRPNSVAVLGSATATDFRTRPAADWGRELLAFLKKIGAGHVAATVVLPRRDVIVRQVNLPGVSDKDLGPAIALQIDSLHPFTDDEVYFSHARIGRTPAVLTGISRRETLDRYASLFAEAGIKVASFTFSAAVLYSAARVITPAPKIGFVSLLERDGELEAYGESEARPVFSASVPGPAARCAGLAASELRIDPSSEPEPWKNVLPKPSTFPPSHDPESPEFECNVLPYAAAVAGATPWLAIDGNLLPPDLRRSSSRIRLIPTIGLASVLLVLTGALAAHSSYADKRYLGVLQHEVLRLEPQARRVEVIDRATADTRARAQSLDAFRRRTREDMDALVDLTKAIPPPGWISSLDMTRENVQMMGEMDQAATLLKTLDSSPRFSKSEFTMPIARSSSGELFHARAARETPPAVTPAPAAPAPAAAEAKK